MKTKYYYEVHVKFPKGGYSICVSSIENLTEDEVIELVPQENFEEEGDNELIDYIDVLTEKEAFEWFGEDRIIKLD
jgi:hypothetical protein